MIVIFLLALCAVFYCFKPRKIGFYLGFKPKIECCGTACCKADIHIERLMCLVCLAIPT